MFKLVIGLALLSLGGYSLWWFTDKPSIGLPAQVEKIFEANRAYAFKTRFGAEQIIDTHRKEILKGSHDKLLQGTTKFYPYALLEVKYRPSSYRTKEGYILWDLTDGEMVLDTQNWKKSHGFADFIRAGISEKELKALACIIRNGGSADLIKLQKESHLPDNFLQTVLRTLERKSLIYFAKEQWRLHISKPLFPKSAETYTKEKFAFEQSKVANKLPKRFSLNQAERLAKMVFGSRFAVRSSMLIYLPVHSMNIQKEDGSIEMSDWNAWTGKRFTALLY